MSPVGPLKKRHHHVPQLYLKRWATEDGVWCLRGDNLFATSPLNLANKRYFYEAECVEVEDMSPFWEMAKSIADPQVRQEIKDWISDYWDLSQMVTGIIGRETELPNLADQIHRLKKNSLENEYAAFEPVLDLFLGMLDEGAPHLAGTELWPVFIEVLSDQYFRTVRQKANGEAFAKLAGNEGFARGWQVRNKVMARLLSEQFLKRKDEYRLVVAQNHTSVPFMTGDQPVVNVHHAKSLNEKSTGFEIYYPISPSRAIMVVKGNAGTESVMHIRLAGFVHQLNQLMRDCAYSELYASERKVLLPYRTTIGSCQSEMAPAFFNLL